MRASFRRYILVNIAENQRDPSPIDTTPRRDHRMLIGGFRAASTVWGDAEEHVMSKIGIPRRLLPYGVGAFALLAGVVGAAWLSGSRAEEGVLVPAPALDQPLASGPAQTAVLAGGCFWGVQGVFQHVKGVQRVLAGYAGGDQAAATY